jgi:dienelactone hydrolase
MKCETITYSIGLEKYSGSLVYDEAVAQPRPALLIAPNWLGVTEAANERGRLLASFGYVVFVADMYGENRRPASFKEAPSFANPLREDPAEARRRICAAYDTLVLEGTRRRLTNNQRAAVGFCFGGGNVLELARDGADVQAAVAIHGDLKTKLPANKGAVKAALLVAHGAPDPIAPKVDRDAFENEMTAAGAKWQMFLFSGVLHAFTDQGADVPGMTKYDESATRQTYTLMNAFIADAFAGRL